MYKNVKAIMSAGIITVLLSAVSVTVTAADYVFDTKGMHAFVQFRVKHLGYSWLYGRFNNFDGKFTFDPEKPEASTLSAEVDMTSLDSNHAERDKHVRSGDFLDVGKHKTAKFVSSKYEVTGKDTGKMTGTLTFMGVSKPMTIDVVHVGGGPDPWGGYRQGFEGRAEITPADFGLDLAKKLGPASATVELFLTVEGIRQ